MKTYKLLTTQQINKPLEEVFNFFQKPENLEKITPPSVGFEIVTPSPIPMKEGVLIDYNIKLMGITMKWQSQIKAYDPPNGFVDVQTKGPYAYWHHKHSFTPNEEGTLVTDEVNYALPFGILGRIARFFFVQHQLKHIFSHRKKVIESVFDTN